VSNKLGKIAGVPFKSGEGGVFAGGGSDGGWEPNYNTPSQTQKAVELNEKLIKTGQAASFPQPIVDTPNIDQMVAEDLQESYREAQRFDNRAQSYAGEPINEGDSLKVIITQEPQVYGGPNRVVFTVMPRIDEQRSVEYDTAQIVHHPGGILKYRTTSTRTWGVSGRLMSRNSSEASENLAIINMIRSWTQPFYGQGTASNVSTADKLGAPPPILTLKGYGPHMIGPVKCVLKSYNWNFDNAIDYITTNDGHPFPVILDITLSLEESWSPAEYSGFDIVKYKSGDLGTNGAFMKVVSTQPPSQAVAPQMIRTTAQAEQPVRPPTAEEILAREYVPRRTPQPITFRNGAGEEYNIPGTPDYFAP
jgi:hypothetical protein